MIPRESSQINKEGLEITNKIRRYIPPHRHTLVASVLYYPLLGVLGDGHGAVGARPICISIYMIQG